jgi:hypothetical protein
LSHVDLQHFAEAKIAQLNFAISHKNIVGFQVPMHNVVLVEFFESLKKLPENDQSLSFLQELFFLQQIFQSTLIAVFIDKIEVIRGFECLDKPDNVLVF